MINNIIPKKLSIYFGNPSYVNQIISDVNSAVNCFKQYDQIIFKKGLEDVFHEDHINTINIINHPEMINTQIFGEIDSTKPFGQIKFKIDLWKQMGAKGIFLNKFGFDYNVTRSHQTNLLNYAHDKDLICIVHSTFIDDSFCNCIHFTCNPNGKPSSIKSTDYYLSLNYQIDNSNYQNNIIWKTTVDKMLKWKQIYGAKMICVATSDNVPFEQNKMDYAYYSTIIYDFDSFCWAEYDLSSDNLLPFRTRKEFYGNKFINNVIFDDQLYQRQTNVGIQLDTINHTTNIILHL